MTKRRWLAMVVLSPFILAMGVVILLTASVSYALNGKWEFKSFFQSLYK